MTESQPATAQTTGAAGLAGMLDRAMARLSALLMVLGCILLVVVMLWIGASILSRAVGGLHVRGTAEVAANGVVAISLLCAPYVVRRGGHIRTGVLVDRLSPTGRRVASAVAHLIGAGVCIFLAWSAWNPMLQSWATGEYSGEGSLRIPTAPLRTIVVLFAVVMAVEFLLTGFKKPRGLTEDEAATKALSPVI